MHFDNRTMSTLYMIYCISHLSFRRPEMRSPASKSYRTSAGCVLTFDLSSRSWEPTPASGCGPSPSTSRIRSDTHHHNGLKWEVVLNERWSFMRVPLRSGQTPITMVLNESWSWTRDDLKWEVTLNERWSFMRSTSEIMAWCQTGDRTLSEPLMA